jgi:undecaprenyl-diphosphatase
MFGPFSEAALLGIVQGVCEFLPFSSDGHRALAALLFKLEVSPALGVLLPVATLAATLVGLWPEVTRMLTEGVRALVAPSRFLKTPGGRDALVVLAATVPTLLLGVVLHAPAERWTRNPLAIGLGFLATTAALVFGHFANPGERNVPSVPGALLLGVAQGMAMFPGLSRSGSTVALALLLGVKPLRAYELSLLMSLPALVLAAALPVRAALAQPFPGASVVVGALVALIFGLLSLRLLREFVIRGRFGWFAFWIGPLSLATLALGVAWPA